MQPTALASAVSSISAQLTDDLVSALRGKSILFAGIGASYAVSGTPAYELRSAGISAIRTDCSDTPPGTPALADVYVAISQSGRSRETSQLVLDTSGPRTLAITNAATSPLGGITDSALSVGNFPDSRVSSIGFTATLVALGMLSDALTGREDIPAWSSVVASLEEIVAQAEPTLARFAADVAEAGEIDVVAAASQITSAEQGALLFREGPLVASTAMNTRAYLHGPMDCAGRRTSHLLFGRSREGILAEQLAEQKAPTLLITDDDVSAPASVIRIPSGLSPSRRALVEIVLAQRLVLLVSEANGVSVDSTVFRRLDTKVDSVDEVRAARV